MTTCVHLRSYLPEFFLEWEVFQKKSCRYNQNTHFMINNFFSENRSIYEIMWKNMVRKTDQQMAI